MSKDGNLVAALDPPYAMTICFGAATSRLFCCLVLAPFASTAEGGGTDWEFRHPKDAGFSAGGARKTDRGYHGRRVSEYSRRPHRTRRQFCIRAVFRRKGRTVIGPASRQSHLRCRQLARPALCF